MISVFKNEEERHFWLRRSKSIANILLCQMRIIFCIFSVVNAITPDQFGAHPWRDVPDRRTSMAQEGDASGRTSDRVIQAEVWTEGQRFILELDSSEVGGPASAFHNCTVTKVSDEYIEYYDETSKKSFQEYRYEMDGMLEDNYIVFPIGRVRGRI